MWVLLCLISAGVVWVVYVCFFYVLTGKMSRSCEMMFVKLPDWCGVGRWQVWTEVRFKYGLLGLYFAVYAGVVGLFMRVVYPNFCMFLVNPEFHNFFCWAVIPVPVVVVLLIQVTNPGNINAENVDHYLNTYPYDSVIYHPAKCSHLLIPAVPRSRFCGFTGQRVARFDHYNSWLVQAVGERNTGLYVLFLFANLSMLTYFLIVCIQMLNWKCDTSQAGLDERGTVWLKVVVALKEEPLVSGVIPFLVIWSLALFCLLARQIFLISINKTTPEIELFQKEIERRKREGIRDPVHNIYDEGVFMNWFDIFIPPTVENRKKRA